VVAWVRGLSMGDAPVPEGDPIPIHGAVGDAAPGVGHGARPAPAGRTRRMIMRSTHISPSSHWKPRPARAALAPSRRSSGTSRISGAPSARVISALPSGQ
jgi:hypothetical protein